MIRRARVLTLVIVLSLIAVLESSGVAIASNTFEVSARDGPTKASLIACSPEKPAVQLGETVELRAWAEKSSNQELTYSWTVAAGAITGKGHKVTWNLKGVDAGIYKATVTVYDKREPIGECSIQVATMDTERGTEVVRETGRSFLSKGTNEAEGYGLYSYLLFGSRPTEGTRDRYLKALEAYLSLIEDISNLEGERFTREELNITYVPVESAPSKNVDPRWLLEHYNYAKARALLDSLPGNRKDGIYIVSCLKRPLSRSSMPPYLIQDLSGLPTSPPDLISWWVREFLNQAAQEHFWEPRTGEMLVLKMRTSIAVLASGLPEVKNALSNWIAWIH